MLFLKCFGGAFVAVVSFLVLIGLGFKAQDTGSLSWAAVLFIYFVFLVAIIIYVFIRALG